MKVYLNRKPVSGPWGGGNKSLILLDKYLASDKDIQLTYDLNESDIDVIFCIDPKPDDRGIWYQDFINYKNNSNKKVKIIQRVGDLGTHRGIEITQLVSQTINFSDFLIFPSNWARLAIGFSKKNYTIIQNRPMSIFYENRNTNNVIDSNKIRIVTHHWSDNPKKGFDMYQKFGKMIKKRKDIEFTYIGRYNSSFNSEGIIIKKPIDVQQLSKTLPEFDIYLTASELEAGANHVLEGLAAGLPVIYKSGGGSIDEYCFDYGIEYSGAEDIEKALNSCINNFGLLKNKVMNFNGNLEQQISQYLDVIKHVGKTE
jgi:hypothetical protein